MKKVKDYVTIDKGIFYTFSTEFSDNYNELFGDLEPITLDTDFYYLCGNRYASSILETDDFKTVVAILIAIYYNNWLHLKEVMEKEIDALAPYYREESLAQETRDKDNAQNDTSANDNIFGFNSETAQGDTETLTATTTKEKRKIMVESTTITKGNNGNFLYSDIIDKEITSRAKQFISLVLHDIENFLTLSIY